jgi:hypothetical protein
MYRARHLGQSLGLQSTHGLRTHDRLDTWSQGATARPGPKTNLLSRLRSRNFRDDNPLAFRAGFAGGNVSTHIPGPPKPGGRKPESEIQLIFLSKGAHRSRIRASVIANDNTN